MMLERQAGYFKAIRSLISDPLHPQHPQKDEHIESSNEKTKFMGVVVDVQSYGTVAKLASAVGVVWVVKTLVRKRSFTSVFKCPCVRAWCDSSSLVVVLGLRVLLGPRKHTS